MQYKNIGQSLAKISVIGQGTGWLFQNGNDDKQLIDTLRCGIECSMNFIDTAEIYGDGHSEEIIGTAVKEIRDRVFIATKVSPEHLSYDDVIRSAEGSLRRLKTDYIDLYQVHWPNPKIPIGETMKAMECLIEQKKIKYIGVCNFSLEELKEAEKCLTKNSIASVQSEYNLFDRTIENDILPYCEKNSIITIAYSPLDKGRIADDSEKIRKLKAIADKYNKNIAQVALNWLVAHPTIIVIPRATKRKHIQQNASSADFVLSENDFNKVSNIFHQKVIYVDTNRIRVITKDREGLPAYQTLEDAIENKLSCTPSPVDLAAALHKNGVLKPARVVRSKNAEGKYDYDLVEGVIRYWAWVIAYNGKKPIPAYVRSA